MRKRLFAASIALSIVLCVLLPVLANDFDLEKYTEDHAAMFAREYKQMLVKYIAFDERGEEPEPAPEHSSKRMPAFFIPLKDGITLLLTYDGVNLGYSIRFESKDDEPFLYVVKAFEFAFSYDFDRVEKVNTLLDNKLQLKKDSVLYATVIDEKYSVHYQIDRKSPQNLFIHTITYSR